MSERFWKDRDPGDEMPDIAPPRLALTSEAEACLQLLKRAENTLNEMGTQLHKEHVRGEMLLTVLASIEWSGQRIASTDDVFATERTCPSCGNTPKKGHHATCVIAIALYRVGAATCSLGGGCC